MEAYRALAALYRKANYLDRELETLETLRRLAPGDAETALRLGDIYLDLGWLEDARQALDQAARAAPEEPRVLIGQATLAYLRHQYPAMEQTAQEGLRRWPQNTALLVILAEADRLQGRYPAAEELLRRAIRLSADPSVQARDYTRLAHLLLEPSWKPLRYAEAEQMARMALRQSPDDLEAHYWLGRALELQGKMAEAESHYALAARQDIQFESVALQLGRIYRRASEPARRAEGERLISLYTTAEANARHFAEARAAVSAHPNDASAHRSVALWYLKSDRAPQAVVELRRTLQLRPTDGQARRLLVSALKSMGRQSEAQAVAQTSAALSARALSKEASP